MKTCTKCGDTKLKSGFHKDPQRSDGLHCWCKDCRSKQRRKHYIDNRETSLAQGAEWRKHNHARQLELQRRHYQENKSKYVAKVVKRKAHVNRATPSWLTKKDLLRIRKEYEIAALLSEATGYSWHVDHIIPIRGHNVSGLHVPENLRVIPAMVNLSKGNSYTFT